MVIIYRVAHRVLDRVISVTVFNIYFISLLLPMVHVSTKQSPSVNLRATRAATIFFSLNFGSSATSVDFLDPVMSLDKWETLIFLSALPAPHTLLLYTLSQVLSTYSREEVYERRFSTRIF